MSDYKACCPHLIPWPDGKACRVCFDDREAKLAEAIPEDVMMRSQEIAAENEILKARLAEAETQVNALRLACNVSAADLIEVGRICGMTDDEYPLKAAQRIVVKVERLREAGGHLRGFAAGTDLGKAYIEAWDAALRGGGE